MPDGWKEHWSNPHDECLALAASIMYHMYQLPDRKAWLRVGGVTQGYCMAQFLTMHHIMGQKEEISSFHLFPLLCKGSCFKGPFTDGVNGKIHFKGRTPSSVQPPAEQEIHFLLQEIQFWCNSSNSWLQRMMKQRGVGLCYLFNCGVVVGKLVFALGRPTKLQVYLKACCNGFMVTGSPDAPATAEPLSTLALCSHL